MEIDTSNLGYHRPYENMDIEFVFRIGLLQMADYARQG